MFIFQPTVVEAGEDWKNYDSLIASNFYKNIKSVSKNSFQVFQKYDSFTQIKFVAESKQAMKIRLHSVTGLDFMEHYYGAYSWNII